MSEEDSNQEILEWLKWLSHVAIPVVFLIPCVLFVWDGMDITWPFFACLSMMCLPFLLILLQQYITHFKAGPVEGWFGVSNARFWDDKERRAPKDDVEEERMKYLVHEEPPQTAQDETRTAVENQHALAGFNQLGASAKKVLRTLWVFQNKTFPPTDRLRRWGFAIRPEASDFAEFAVGSSELLEKGWIHQNESGLIFLSNFGMEACSQIALTLQAASGNIWTKFSPA